MIRWVLAASAALAGLLFVVLAGAGGPGAERHPQFTPPAYLREPVAADGTAADIYRRDCAYCHGADGSGTYRGPDLDDVGNASAHYWISTGRMPVASPDAEIRRGEPNYPPKTVAALVDYVAGLRPGGIGTPDLKPHESDLGRGFELWTLQCAACHVWSGVGGALLYREAPEVTGATARQIAEAVRIGPGNMPAFGEAALDEEDLNDLVAYTRYLADPRDRGGAPLWHLGPFAEGAVAWMTIPLILVGLVWLGTRERSRRPA